MKYINELTERKATSWQGKRWYHQRFDGCPYLLHYIAEAEITRHDERKRGGDFSVHFCFFKDGKADWYINLEDIKRVSTAIIDLGKENPAISKELMDAWKEYEERFYAMCERIKKTEFSELSDEELIALHDEFLNTALDKNSSSSIIDGFALGTDELIAEEVRKVYERSPLKERMRFTEAFSLLTAPSKLSFINKAELHLLRTALAIRKEPSRKEELLTEHQQAYFWILNNYVDDILLDTTYFAEEIAKREAVGDIEGQISQLENAPTENEKRKEELLEELEISDHLRLLIRVSDDFTHWQDERKRGTLWTTHYAISILREVGKRIGVDVELLKYLSPREMSKVFEEKPAAATLQERQRNCVFYWEKEGYECLAGEACDEVHKALLGEKNLEDISDFRGLTAQAGVARGTVKVVRSAKEIDKVEQGDILVAVMTRPDYIPAMKKAVAIVTDEGGVTCHAAIISRELGIPCVIGTKIATKILKDGMRVEVNANHSVVRRLR